MLNTEIIHRLHIIGVDAQAARGPVQHIFEFRNLVSAAMQELKETALVSLYRASPLSRRHLHLCINALWKSSTRTLDPCTSTY